MRWVVLSAAHCEGTLRSPGLASCAVAAGSIHHNLTFNWRGARSETERRQQREREKEAIETQREGCGVYLHLGDGFTEE